MHVHVVDDEQGPRDRRALVQALARGSRRRVSQARALSALLRLPGGVLQCWTELRTWLTTSLRRHEDARCGPGVGVSKGSKPKKKTVKAGEAGNSAPSTSKRATAQASTSGDKPWAEKMNDEWDLAGEPPKKKGKKERDGGKEVLLAKKFDLDTRKQDPTGWWISEKRES